MDSSNQQIDSTFLQQVEGRLYKMKMQANWTGVAFILTGFLAIATNVFITAFTGTVDSVIIRIMAFIATLCLSLIGAFNLSLKASKVRDGWKHLNKAVLSYKANMINAEKLIKAWEESENILGHIDFTYTKNLNTTEIKNE